MSFVVIANGCWDLCKTYSAARRVRAEWAECGFKAIIVAVD